MPRRTLALAFLLLSGALPANAQEAGPLRLTCRADDSAQLAQPLNFSINLDAKQAEDTGTKTRFGVTAYRDGLGLWDPERGPGHVLYRIDLVKGRFVRTDKDGRLDGSCEKVER